MNVLSINFLNWIRDNLSTIVVAIVVAVVFAVILIKLIKDKKAGKCSCGCSNCPNSSVCHQKTQKKNK